MWASGRGLHCSLTDMVKFLVSCLLVLFMFIVHDFYTFPALQGPFVSLGRRRKKT